MMSWIQNHILLELTRHKTRRYKELRPRDVEGNLFMYHLKGLIRDDVVQKGDGNYLLTNKGMQVVARMSLKTGKTRLQPKLLTAVIANNEEGKQLFVTWHRQPNIGQVSLPYGMVHFGESMADMAALELAEKAGLTGDLRYKGDISIRGMRGNDVDRHMLIHLFEATNVRPDPKATLRPDVCEWFWEYPEKIPQQAFVPGFFELNKYIMQGHTGLYEITVTVDEVEK